MATFAVYADVPDYQTNGTAFTEVTTLVGGNTTTSGTTSAGAVSLPLVATTGFPSSGSFTAWVLDGLNSETATASVSGGNLSIPAGLVYAHGAGVSVSSAGPQGCLASAIRSASRTIDSICRQGPDGTTDRTLYAVARTDTLSGPSSNCVLDRDGSLLLRPYHFPVASSPTPVVTLQQGAQTAATLNTQYAYSPDGGRVYVIPAPQIVGSAPPSSNWLGWSYARNAGLVAKITYTGGPITGAALSGVPDDIRQVCFYLVSDLLGYRRNPTGAAEVRQGDVNYSFRLRGDTSGNSILMIQARTELEAYTRKPY